MFPVDIIIRVDAKKENDSGEYTFQCKALGELVRCGECIMGFEECGEKYCGGEYHKLDWFCADGKRKDGE